MEEKASKNFSYVALGRIILSVVQAVFYLIFAALLAPADYGLMGYLIALAGTFSVISRFGLAQTVVVFRAKENFEVANQLNLLALITTSLGSLILLFINEFAALLCLGISFFFLYQNNLLGEKRYKEFLKDSIIRSVLIFVLPFPLFYVLGVPGIILGMGLGNLTSGLWLLKYLTIKGKLFHLIKNNYKVIINNFGVDASATLVRWLDKILVGAVFGFVFLGLYHFNMQVLYAFEILPRALYLFLLSEESSGKKHKKISFIVVLVSILIVVAVIIFSPIVIQQFFPNYLEGVFGLQILVVSLVPLSISYIITAKMQAEESTKIGYSAIVRIGSLLVLLSLLGNLYGLIGFSLSVLISAIVNAIFVYFLYYNSTRKGNLTKVN